MTVVEQGTLRPDDERCAVRFERLYDFTAEELWQAISDPEQVRGWLGPASRWRLVPGEEYELDVGGRTWGRIRHVEPGRVLELDWNYEDEPASVLRLEVVPRERGALLVLDHRRLDRASAAAYGAGWHSHLDALGRLLEGRPLERPAEWWDRFNELRPAYDELAEDLGHDWRGHGGTPLHDAVASGDEEEARALARERPELRAQTDSEGLIPSMRALYFGRRELAAELAPADERLDVLHAAALGRVERLRSLLAEDPALAAAWSADGFTPLHIACFGGKADAVRALLEHGADPEVVSSNAEVRVRPLGTAAFARTLDCVRVLLEAGADPNGAGDSGFVPLHTAAGNGDAELVELLLEHGADPSLATDDGRTPESLARASGHDEVAGRLAAAA